MTDRDLIIDYRIRVIRTGLIVAWIGMVMLALWAFSLDLNDIVALATIIGSFGAGLIIVTFAPWRSMLTSRVGDWAILIWSATSLLAVLLFDTVSEGTPNGIGLLLVMFFAAATLIPNVSLITLGAGATIAFAASIADAGVTAPVDFIALILPFVGAIIFVLLISVGIRTQLEATDAAYRSVSFRGAELARQEQQLSNLYDVSRTIGAGSKLNEVLPELIGRVADSVNARVGLVLLYNGDDEQLELMSPIWVSGHTVRADEFSLGLDEPGICQRVFLSGDATAINEMHAIENHDRLAMELEASRVAAVAMRVENRTIGVLLVGDKPTDFTEDDIDTLESVAAPAALVLNQMTRFEKVQTTGERMAELARLKTDFVSVVSHELRTPLTSIIGAIGTLQRPELLPDDPRAQQLIQMAAKQANRLRTLIEDLLVMSRIEAESLPVRPEQIKLEPFLVDLLDSLYTDGRVTHTSTQGIDFVRSDPDHLARVITNLVENAIKYGGDGPIEVVTSSGRDEVLTSVVDHGPGIAYEQHDVIFERFTQLQPHATRSMGGAGLGLSIVKGLVEAMDGRVWYEPTPGGGATFTFAIPTAGPSATDPR
ncbi:MAG: ATP-binding protein [Actinomycetota bacterium]